MTRRCCGSSAAAGDSWRRTSGSNTTSWRWATSHLQPALNILDGDEATYVNLNNRDEASHAQFLNGYLGSKGLDAVSLEEFRSLPSSQATGSNKTAKRLTSLFNLTVDTSWYFRYRSAMNPDFGATFPQIVDLVNVPGIPEQRDLPSPVDSGVHSVSRSGFEIQFIANVAGFHLCATIEQGGSSPYQSLRCQRRPGAWRLVRIIGAIGGTEIQHFQTWQDKAGNALQVVNPNNGAGAVSSNCRWRLRLPNPPNGTDNAGPNDTNQIFAAPARSFLKICRSARS